MVLIKESGKTQILKGKVSSYLLSKTFHKNFEYKFNLYILVNVKSSFKWSFSSYNNIKQDNQYI